MAFEVTGRKMSSFQETSNDAAWSCRTLRRFAPARWISRPRCLKRIAVFTALTRPCAGACPTHIDVPRFIKKIATGNLGGSARTILDANILGASCARACPVEVLCEGACVMHRYNKQPIEIARLQRHAMDALYESGAPLPFEPGADTGWSVGLIGAGAGVTGLRSRASQEGRSGRYLRRAAAAWRVEYLRGSPNTSWPLVESLREIDMLAQLGVNFQFGTWV